MLVTWRRVKNKNWPYIYYILVGMLGLVALTYNEVKSSQAGVAEYFICESLGNPNTKCHFGEEFVEVLKAFTTTDGQLLLSLVGHLT